MKRILRSRLPERLAGRLPPALVEIGVGLGIALLMTLVRLLLVPWTGGVAPFALVFVGVAAAAVLAGWRSGLIALVVGQILTWFFVFPPSWSFQLPQQGQIGGLVLATLGQLLALAIITLYQREVDRAWSRREAQVDLIHQALVEIDHRTVNNYQTVLSLILAQANRADAPVKEALQQVADRINAIALASKQLALSSENLEEVRVTHHLGELCAQIKQGLSRPEVSVKCEFDDLSVGSEQAVAISILVNELVTNALKHAFPDDRQGEIRVKLGKSAEGMLLEIADDGVGMAASRRTRGTGLGTRLVETFAKQLRARHEIDTGGTGTCHRIHFPPAT